jgi:hypothetical protein
MTTDTQNSCPRCYKHCKPLSNISSDGDTPSFICVGWNMLEDRQIPQDRFTLCWKNSEIDQEDHWDKRDLLDTASVILQALSIDENVRVREKMTEEDMQLI